MLLLILVIGWLRGARLPLTYCWVCLYAKRLHDMGKSAVLADPPIPYGVWLIPVVAAVVMGGMAVVNSALVKTTGDDQRHQRFRCSRASADSSPPAGCRFPGRRRLLLLWMGSPKGGQPGENRFGDNRYGSRRLRSRLPGPPRIATTADVAL